jgi:predicted TIM-barrel fold metal-dependent hydrolase
MVSNEDIAAIKRRLGHPVVDSDGHVVESIAAVSDLMRRIGGDDVAARFIGSSPAYRSRHAPILEQLESAADLEEHRWIHPWWTLPTNARDRATGFLPRLMHERLEELGIDFSVLFPSLGLTVMGHPDDDIRRVASRAVNEYLAQVLDGLGDRLTATAVIPTHTPDEAIVELDHAVNELGFKAVMLNTVVRRPQGGALAGGSWIDTLGLDNPYDYDPVWQRCVDLGVAVTGHAPTMGFELRQSSSRYMYNHIGTFAASSEAFAKALFFGGVTNRFPTLNFGFMECGVAWGVQLLCDLVSRFEKRAGGHIESLDPDLVDAAEWDRLLVAYGGDLFLDANVRASMRGQSDNPPAAIDDFRDCGLKGVEDIGAQFENFYFGCEADEATISWAFATDVNPNGAVLRPVFGSDLGHWDVPDMRGVLPEAYELIEDRKLDADEFRAFSCDNPIRLHGRMNPAFFDGTTVEKYARELLDGETTAGQIKDRGREHPR